MDEKQTQIQAWWQPALVLFAKISGWIVTPVVVGLFAGRLLDDRFGTEPRLFFVCIAGAFAITMVGLVTEGKRALKEITTIQ